jgi:ABC-2 type transport system permease protein
MRASIVGAVIRREWRELVRNRLLVFTILVPPAILVALPVVVVHVSHPRPLPPDVAAAVIASRPNWAGMSPTDLVAAFSLQQFLATFLILPGYIPLAIATFSIVGEKQSRSLEAVLATPIRTVELLAGKAVSALVPGILASWFAFAVLVVLSAITVSPQITVVFADPSWIAAVFVLGPAIGLVSVVAGIIVSSRVNDPRVAQQIGSLVILPVLGIVVLQTASGHLFEAREYVIGAVIVAVVGIAGLRVAASLFGRESILTRWR